MTFPIISPQVSALDLPQLNAKPGMTLQGWAHSGPQPGSTAFIEKQLVEQVGESLQKGQPMWKDIPMGFEPLSSEAYREGGPGRIDLSWLYDISGAKGTYVFAGNIDISEKGHHRLIIDRLRAVAILSGVRLEDGAVFELEPGTHTLVVLADNLADYPWDLFYLQPRLIPCSSDAGALVSSLSHHRALSAKRARESAPANIDIDYSSAIGQEGFVRAAKSYRGTWWFLDPANRPFYYQGVTSVNRMGTQGGRRALPGDHTVWVDKLHNYSEDGPEAYVQATLKKIGDSGLNGLGSWTHPEFFEREGFYTTDIIEAIRVYPHMKNSGWCDVFDPGWEKRVDEVAKAICLPQKDSQWLLGYFTENEITFPAVGTMGYNITGEPIYNDKALSLLQVCLNQEPTAPGFQEAWRFCIARHGDLAAVAKAWSVDADQIMTLEELKEKGFQAAQKNFVSDAHAFSVHFAERFFKVCYEAIKRHDPNHLVIGCRWAGPPHPEVLAAEEKWTDVVSINNYQDMLYERMAEYEFSTDIPVIIGEYNWADDGHMSIELPFEPEAGLTLDERRIYTGERYLKKLFLHSRVAGWTWYRWVTTNRLRSFRNCGIINHEDVFQTFNAEPLHAITAHAHPSRAQWDHTPEVDASLEDGDYTLHLQGSSASEGKARIGKVVCGFTIKDGQVAPSLSGYGLKGTVKLESGFVLTIEGEFTEVVFRRGQGRFEMKVQLTQRKGDHFSGRHQSHWMGRDLSGIASAWKNF